MGRRRMTVPDVAPCELHEHRLEQLEMKDRELNGSVRELADELKEVRLDLPKQFAEVKSSVNATIRNWFIGTIIVLVVSRALEVLL